MSNHVPSSITLRPATLADVAWLERWDQEPDVIAATSDDPTAEKAFADTYWPDELASQSDVYRYFIAELAGRPIGAMQICDPRLESSHYWGEVEPDLRAIDIWIGEASDRGQGYGAEMMDLAMARCFAEPSVRAIVIDPLNSNTRAHAFYRRLGFKALERRSFGDDNCLVHQLTRADWASRQR